MTMATRFETPDQTEAAFYAAFEAMNTSRMAEVWDAAPDSFCVHPGGDLLQGGQHIVASWTAIFANARRPRVRYRVIDRKQTGGLAVHLVEEHIGLRETRATGNRILATNCYRHTADGWRLCGHHGSLPLTTERSREQGPARRLH